MSADSLVVIQNRNDHNNDSNCDHSQELMYFKGGNDDLSPNK